MKRETFHLKLVTPCFLRGASEARPSAEWRAASIRGQRRIQALIDTKEDSVRIYRLCLDCDRQVEIQGTGRLTEDPDVYVL